MLEAAFDGRLHHVPDAGDTIAHGLSTAETGFIGQHEIGDGNVVSEQFPRRSGKDKEHRNGAAPLRIRLLAR